MSFLMSILLSIATSFGFHPAGTGGGSAASHSGPHPDSGSGPVGRK